MGSGQGTWGHGWNFDRFASLHERFFPQVVGALSWLNGRLTLSPHFIKIPTMTSISRVASNPFI
jgi:hypothetical protein